MTSLPDLMQWFGDEAAPKLPTSYDVLLILSVFHLVQWMYVRPLDPESKRAARHLCVTRHTTALATLLLLFQTAGKTALAAALRLAGVERGAPGGGVHAALWAFAAQHGSARLLPRWLPWWVGVPFTGAFALLTMAGLFVRFPVDGVDIDARRVSSLWALRLQHEYGVLVPRRRRPSFGCELYCAEDDDGAPVPAPADADDGADARSDTSSAYDRAEEARQSPEDRVHLSMSAVLRLRREGVDLDKWRYGPRMPTMADSRPSWL